MPATRSFNGKDRFVLQLIPCGILRPGKHAVIGSGVVVDPAALVGGNGNACEGRDRCEGPVAPQQSRAFDFSLSPAKWKRPRKRARRGENRHNFARHRSGVRRQDGAARIARVRFDGYRKCFGRKRERVIAEKNAVCRRRLRCRLDFGGMVERL